MLSIPELRTREALALKLALSPQRVQEILDHLVASGLAVQKGGRYEIGHARIHLSKDSPLISQHHSNWRKRALQSLDEPGHQDLHYSLAMTLSRQDVDQIRELLLATVQKAETIFRPSREEEAFAFCLDYFRI